MPCDLSDLLPHVTYLLLTLPEPERLERLRARERLGVAMTQEQRRLEENKVNERLRRAYGAVRVAGRPLLEVSASGAASEVLSRASHLLQQLPGSHVKPLSENWHYTRACNYHCKFCFHTAKSSFFLPATEEGMAEAKCCLTRLRDKGMEKMNFSGGEPSLGTRKLQRSGSEIH